MGINERRIGRADAQDSVNGFKLAAKIENVQDKTQDRSVCLRNLEDGPSRGNVGNVALAGRN